MHMGTRVTEPLRPDADEDTIHQLFEVLRDRVVTVTSEFQTRVQGGLDDIDGPRTEGRVSVVRVLLSSLLQASNVVLGALKADDQDDADTLE